MIKKNPEKSRGPKVFSMVGTCGNHEKTLTCMFFWGDMCVCVLVFKKSSARVLNFVVSNVYLEYPQSNVKKQWGKLVTK